MHCAATVLCNLQMRVGVVCSRSPRTARATSIPREIANPNAQRTSWYRDATHDTQPVAITRTHSMIAWDRPYIDIAVPASIMGGSHVTAETGVR